MSPAWKDLLASDAEERVLPWTGGRKVFFQTRAWRIAGPLPNEYGWFRLRVSGREATVLESADPDPDFEQHHALVRGYVTGDRMIADDARVELDPTRLIEQTERVFLVEPGLERFCRAVSARTGDGTLIYIRQEFPQGPEDEVAAAYQERLASVSHVANVTPALDLAFRWLTWQRDELQRYRERLAEEARQRQREEQQRLARERMREQWGMQTGEERRELAQRDFESAAREALAISGAELLDTRQAYNRNEMVVQYRFRRMRLECVVDRRTLRVIDSGVCLTDESTGERGDQLFTLESLPPVIGEAIDNNVLVVYRHA